MSATLLIWVKVQPGAKKTEVLGLEPGLHPSSRQKITWLRVRLAAPPVDGKANQALCAFFADWCDVPRSQVTLISGETSRLKRLLIDHPRHIPEVLLGLSSP